MYIKNSATIFHKLTFAMVLMLMVSSACNQTKQRNDSTESFNNIKSPKFTLGQWTYNKALFNNEMTTFDFIRLAAEADFEGVEYVNQFFLDQVQNAEFLDSLISTAKKNNIKSTLLIIDAAGNLGASDSTMRANAIETHKKWIDAAQIINCPTVRINAYGDGSPELIKSRCISSITSLARHAQKLDIEILIENHGGISNNGAWLASLIKDIGLSNVHALADIDNWCIERENGKLWGAPCIHRYDPYQGMRELMPYAKAISIKSFEFDEDGNEKNIDFVRFFEIIKSHDFDGYLGIEYEGEERSVEEGIQKTIQLATQAWNNN